MQRKLGGLRGPAGGVGEFSGAVKGQAGGGGVMEAWWKGRPQPVLGDAGRCRGEFHWGLRSGKACCGFYRANRVKK